MQLERTDLLSHNPCIAVGGDGTQQTVRELKSECAISIDKRQLDPDRLALLASVDLAKLERIRLAGSAESISQAIFRRLKVETTIPSGIVRWLCDDIGNLIRLYGRLTGAQAFLVRFEAINNDGCSRFHADNMRYRLVTTYSGPGTQWIAPPYAADIQDRLSDSSAMIRQIGTGWIALMRGRKAETASIPAVLHRSPPMRGITRPRLFLAIDDLADHSAALAGNL